MTLSCPAVVEELVAGAEDAEARERGEAALEAFQRAAEVGREDASAASLPAHDA
ncbi:MAG: hypothetical protein H5T75_08385 [Coriobacteriia bacterium]|nr:hypothetical protein [Coriobacteriia bacterium]